MIDKNGMKHDSRTGQFTSGGSTPAEQKRADEIIGAVRNETIEEIKTREIETNAPEDISGLLGKEYTGFKGKQAIDKLMREKQGYVKNAFYRDDIGNIDILWGNDDIGLQHIIKRRESENLSIMELTSGLTEVIENGMLRKSQRGNYEILKNKYVAVIQPEFKGNKMNFVVTAYRTRKDSW